MSESFGLAEHAIGEPYPADAEYQTRRRLAAALRAFQEQLVRLDAPEPELAGWADQLETMVAQAGQHGHRNQMEAFRRLFLQQGTRQDVLDAFDHEIMTGLSSAMAPPLTLWRDGRVIRGRARLGPPWQGPPGRVHGGAVALMLDILMAKAQDLVEGLGVTGTLNIRYQAATPLNTDIDMEARVLRLEGRKLFVEGRFLLGEALLVRAEGVWICTQGEYCWKPGCAPDEEAS